MSALSVYLTCQDKFNNKMCGSNAAADTISSPLPEMSRGNKILLPILILPPTYPTRSLSYTAQLYKTWSIATLNDPTMEQFEKCG